MRSTTGISRVACIVAMLSALGCGGDDGQGADGQGGDGGQCVDPGTPDPITGLFSEPADFDRTECEAGAMADFDPSGLWLYIEDSRQTFGSTGTIRFSNSCQLGVGVRMGFISSLFDAGFALASDDDVMWRLELQFDGGAQTFVRSFNMCRDNGDGSYRGQSVTCVTSPMGENCQPEGVTLVPYGRIPGEQDGDGLTLVGEFNGTPAEQWPDTFTANVRVQDGVAYVVRSSDGLRIVDVSTPSAPAALGHFVTGEERWNDVKIVNPPLTTIAVLASDVSGAFLVDVTDPTSPTQVGFIANQNGVHTVFTEEVGGIIYLYLGGVGAEVPVYDITDPTAPSLLGTFVMPDQEWGVHDLFVEQGRAYINATSGGLVVVDYLPDPSQPVFVDNLLSHAGFSHSNWVTTAAGRKIAVTGDEGFGAHIEIVDVDPSSGQFMQQIGEFVLRDEVSVHNILAIGDKAYVAHYQDGVRILDLSNPTAPTQAAYFNTYDPDTSPGNTFEGAVGIDVDTGTGLIYLADTPRGLLILQETP